MGSDRANFKQSYMEARSSSRIFGVMARVAWKLMVSVDVPIGAGRKQATVKSS
jgi:hypothetical protein